ncbi:NAD(+) synthase [Candidatus Kuenenbacteria bacterium]|nr:NAD(+) synthase [Candidatus Kuenenbacteria bacterium]
MVNYRLTEKKMLDVLERQARLTFEYARDHGIHNLVVGSSGGKDSAYVLAVNQWACVLAQRNGYELHSIGVIMPCESDPNDERLGRQAIRKFGAEEMRVDFTDLFQVTAGTYPWRELLGEYVEDASKLEELLGRIPGAVTPLIDAQIQDFLERTGQENVFRDWNLSGRVTQGNIKARFRMALGVYHIARRVKGIVSSTDNQSEYWMGFWTIHGDVGDFGVIQHVLKGLELYDLCCFVGVPQEIIDDPPKDGLGVSEGGDAGQIGAPYKEWEPIFIQLIKAGFDPNGSKAQLKHLPFIAGADPDLVYKLAARAVFSKFKRVEFVVTREMLGLPAIEEIDL